jgi:hypothetical protein
MQVVPNRFRDTGVVAGVDSGCVASAGNSGEAAKVSFGDISAGGGENPGANDNWRRGGREILGVEFAAEYI